MLDATDDISPYLRQEVLSASPLRLRWMLIRRAEELCQLVEELWDRGDEAVAQQWLLRLREILGELLGGITSHDNPLGQTVADFYVFLLKLAHQVRQPHDVDTLRTLKGLLQIENETWQMVVQKFDAEATDNPASLPAEEPPLRSDVPPAPTTPEPSAWLGGDSLSLEI
ncbi:MAG: hypothetical protein KatS3mg111_2132 [Pirellulaceae bacterium]|nr:MAG: hypothetical protein KatS3mg111_2132 [Pirellulaceae bacterium]